MTVRIRESYTVFMRARKMNKRIYVLFFLVACFILFSQARTFGFTCPPFPEQVNKDWETEVNAAVMSMGSIKGAEFKVKVKRATEDLLAKIPDAGKIYLEQMMYSTYCSVLKE